MQSRDTSPELGFNLLCQYAIREIADVLETGARTHPGQDWSEWSLAENANHAIIHLVQWSMGDRKEDHLANALTRLMMAVHANIGCTCRNHERKMRIKEVSPDVPNRSESSGILGDLVSAGARAYESAVRDDTKHNQCHGAAAANPGGGQPAAPPTAPGRLQRQDPSPAPRGLTGRTGIGLPGVSTGLPQNRPGPDVPVETTGSSDIDSKNTYDQQRVAARDTVHRLISQFNLPFNCTGYLERG